MSTLIRPELSKRNKYYIPEHRYYELKHFCLQYPFWKEKYLECDSMVRSNGLSMGIRSSDISDPVANAVIERDKYFRLMEMVEQAAIATDAELYQYILKSVCEGVSFVALQQMHGIPCGKDMFYDRYRKFFWILDKKRDFFLS